jgi:hypothetical protein
MPSDLDQAYIINGDGLRIALIRTGCKVERVAADVAADILDKFAKPYEARTADVQALAAALSRTRISFEQAVRHDHDRWSGIPAQPEALAECLLEEMDGQQHAMPAPPRCDCGADEGSVSTGAPLPAQCLHDGPECACQLPGWDGGLTGTGDPELDALHAIKDALCGLPADAQRNIIRYWAARVEAGMAAADPF